MKCVKPIWVRHERSDRVLVGCGQCMPCRFNKQRVWFHRIMLEAACHAGNCFVTLTYKLVPSGGSVVPRDLQLWTKRLRKRLEPRRIRVFQVGEYGDRSFRPHYHSILFGAGCGLQFVDGECRCLTCSAVRETWTSGWCSVSPLTKERAKYIAKYTLKKMMTVGDERLLGRHPEFVRMSRRPYGIGANALWDVASAMIRYKQVLPTSLLHDQSALPLGRYLRMKLASYADVEVPSFVDKELSLVQAFAFANSRSLQSVYEELWAPYEAALLNNQRVSNEKSKI